MLQYTCYVLLIQYSIVYSWYIIEILQLCDALYVMRFFV